MNIRHLFVMDPLDRINLVGDSTFALMAEATARGWDCWACTPADLYADRGVAHARALPVRTLREPAGFVADVAEDRALGDFDVVWMRKDPPFDIEYVFATFLLDLAPASTLVFNDPAALRGENEKIFALRWPQFCPSTLVSRDMDRAVAFAQAAPGRVVLKPWDGMAGRGILVTDGQDRNLRSMLELLTEEGHRHILIQHYVPQISEGDKRIILVDGEPLGWMLRVPSPRDHRGNMHVGARVQACELTDRDREICGTIAPQLRKKGLIFVGIDTIGPFLTEINVTSPTGIREINQLLGVRIEERLTDIVQARVESARRHLGDHS